MVYLRKWLSSSLYVVWSATTWQYCAKWFRRWLELRCPRRWPMTSCWPCVAGNCCARRLFTMSFLLSGRNILDSDIRDYCIWVGNLLLSMPWGVHNFCFSMLFRRNHSSASNSACSYAFLRSAVCLSSVTFVHPAQTFYGFTCHLAGAVAGSSDGVFDPQKKGKFGRRTSSQSIQLQIAATWRIETWSDSVFYLMTLVLVCFWVVSTDRLTDGQSRCRVQPTGWPLSMLLLCWHGSSVCCFS